jgi:DNA repair protein RadC
MLYIGSFEDEKAFSHLEYQQKHRKYIQRNRGGGLRMIVQKKNLNNISNEDSCRADARGGEDDSDSGTASNSNPFLGHRKRLRERFLKGGLKALSDHELLELILTYAIPRRDVKEQAKALLKKFSSLPGVFSANSKGILSIKGLNKESAALISLVHAAHVKYFEKKMLGGDPLSSPEDVVNFSRVFLSWMKKENFAVIFVSSKNRVIGYELMSEGTIDSAAVYPREIMEMALNNKAHGIILVHNHPSGETSPSEEDLRLTRAVKNAAETMGVRVLDHLIVGENEFMSFLDKKLL